MTVMDPEEKKHRDAYSLVWIIKIPSLEADRITIIQDRSRISFGIECDSPTIVVPGRYMLDSDDAEEALFAAICQVMPRSAIIARKGMPTPKTATACAGMGQCYWLRGQGWLDEPREGAAYFDPFDLLKKTPFLYKV